jgi:single-strand DNA-binding protein
MAINQITIEGNVGSDPEMKFTNDESLASFSLAHTPWSKTKGDGETMWFRVTFWSKKADSVMDNVKKGDKLLVIGSFKHSTYTDKEGNSRSSLDITGSEFAILPRNAKNSAPQKTEAEVAPW